jgi:nucleotide-binding universal stress UspA family protein
VGCDGSPSSRRALRYAAEIAPQLHLPLHALVAWDYPNVQWGDNWSYYYPDMDADFPQNANEVAKQEAAAAFPGGIPDWVSSGARRGHPAQVLIDASRDAALLVVGSRGHGGFAGLLLGSVSHACASRAHCPVLVVRGEAPATHDAPAEPQGSAT